MDLVGYTIASLSQNNLAFCSAEVRLLKRVTVLNSSSCVLMGEFNIADKVHWLTCPSSDKKRKADQSHQVVFW